MGEYIDVIIEHARFAAKLSFLIIPAIIISFLLSVGNGTLDYYETKESIVTFYTQSNELLESLDPSHLKEVFTDLGGFIKDVFGDYNTDNTVDFMITIDKIRDWFS